jgi:ribose-phosphate pyrophosphokinase
MTKPLIFDATAGKSALYKNMLATGRYEEGRLVRKVYGDGEVGHFLHPDLETKDDVHPSLHGTVYKRQVVVVGDWSTNELIVDHLDVSHTAFDETAEAITLVVDKDSIPTDPARRRALFELFAQVPRSGGRIVVMEADRLGAPEYKKIRTRKKPRTTDSAAAIIGDCSKPVLIYTSSYKYLAEEMMALGDFELGEFAVEELDGKPFFKKLETDVLGRRVILVSGAVDAREIMEQHYMARAILAAGALWLDRIQAYLQCATMERKTKSGEAVKAKIRARLLSALPQGRTRVIFCDLHSEGIPYYLEGEIQPHHTYIGKHLVAAHAREMLGLPSTDKLGTIDLHIEGALQALLTLLATDSGRAKWVDSMGLDIGLLTAFGRKIRLDDGVIEFLGALGPVLGRNGLEYDDKCGTGGTAIKAGQGVRIDQYGKALLESLGFKFDDKGKLIADSVKLEELDLSHVPTVSTEACFSHFVGSAAVVKKMRDAKDVLGRPLFRRIVAANTTPNAQALHDGVFFFAKSIAPLLVATVTEIGDTLCN